MLLIDEWVHVSKKENPVDIIFRGCDVEAIKKRKFCGTVLSALKKI